MTAPQADARARVYERLDARFDEFVDGLTEFARIPTISAFHQAQREGAEATLKILGRAAMP